MNNEHSSNDLAFVTPTYRHDFERFALLRRSIEAFDQGHIPHFAIVDSEDFEDFQKLGIPNVEVISSADLLAQDVESRRIAYNNSGGRHYKRFQRSMNKRFGWFPNSKYYGWHIQQILKFAAIESLPFRTQVVFDSDIVVTGPFGIDTFVKSGKPVLYEKESTLAKAIPPKGWLYNACKIQDVEPYLNAGAPNLDYVAVPFVFDKETTHQLLKHIELIHSKDWWDCFLQQPLGQWSEFMTYGVYVRENTQYQNVVVELANGNNRWISSEAERKNADSLIKAAFEDPETCFLVLQSDDHGDWPIERFIPILEKYLPKRA